jgi:Polyketide cyclase / dehydrase and lipid transport
MTGPEYRFVSRWSVLGTPEEVSDVLSDPLELSRWWPSVYLDVAPIAAGDDRGVGRSVRIRSRGFLPYTLDWELRVIASDRPGGFSVESTGDLVGRGVWRFEPAGARTLATYDWRVRAEKPLLRVLSPVLRPLLAANHRWAMRRGEESLELELTRRRASTPLAKSRIPAPPSPAASPALVLVLGAGAVLGLTGYALARRLSDRKPRSGRHRR